MKNWIVIILTGLVLISCACKKKESYPEIVNMVPLVPVSISPVQKTYPLNDTLWLNIDFVDSLTDLNSGRKYRFPDFEFKNAVSFLRLVNKDQPWAGAPGEPGSFTFVNQVGGITDIGGFAGTLRFIHENDHYKAKVGIVLRSKGVFLMNLFTRNIAAVKEQQTSLLDFIKLEDAPDGRKRFPNLEWILYIINDGNTNFDLLKEYSLTDAEQNVQLAQINKIYEEKGTFTFIVE